MTDIANVKPTLSYTKSVYTGTTKYATVVDDAIKYYDVVSDKQTLIGWCGAQTFAEGSVATINKNSSNAALTYPILSTKADLDNLTTAQPNYLYYINK